MDPISIMKQCFKDFTPSGLKPVGQYHICGLTFYVWDVQAKYKGKDQKVWLVAAGNNVQLYRKSKWTLEDCLQHHLGGIVAQDYENRVVTKMAVPTGVDSLGNLY